jgi:hypothetical protein
MKFFIFIFFISLSMACESPLKLGKFEFLTQKAKLQAPTSKVSHKLNKAFCNEYFYLSDGKYMTFRINEKENDHKRSELRFFDEWNVSTLKEKFIYERVKLVKFNKKEFTFLQIHDGNKPLLRILWHDRFKNRVSHLWAFVRLNELNRPYSEVKVFDLGETPNGFFDIKVCVQNSVLRVYVNGTNSLRYDVSYWKNPSYFKTGVYLQNPGEAEIYVEDINISD